MSQALVIWALALGWAAQAVTWVSALRRVGGAAAAGGEWGRELVVRGVQLALIVAALVARPGAIVPLTTLGAGVLLLAYFAGHGLAIAGRLQLGPAWGIGTGPPRYRAPVVRTGVYRFVAHPIYLGTGAAIAAQAALLQNLQALALLAAAAVVNAWKIARENRWLRS